VSCVLDYTELDKLFYLTQIAPRIPRRVFDTHVHVYLPEHVSRVPDSVWLSNWALESSRALSADDVHECVRRLYPDTEYRFGAFPMPVAGIDRDACNHYLAQMGREGKLVPLMLVDPQSDPELAERDLIESQFAGFKPYPTLAGDGTGNDVGIFDFMPREFWAILDRHGKAVMLHLPRKERLADLNNVRELLEARDKFPNVHIILAHLGRSYCPYFLERGLAELGDPTGFLFDTTAVLNPAVYDIAFDRIPTTNILYGTDLNVFLWHGKREWDEREYHNLCREEFTWKKIRRPREVEEQYTLFLYEQMRAILDAMDRHQLSPEDRDAIFYGNARRALGFTA